MPRCAIGAAGPGDRTQFIGEYDQRFAHQLLAYARSSEHQQRSIACDQSPRGMHKARDVFAAKRAMSESRETLTSSRTGISRAVRAGEGPRCANGTVSFARIVLDLTEREQRREKCCQRPRSSGSGNDAGTAPDRAKERACDRSASLPRAPEPALVAASERAVSSIADRRS